jgi:hypothetical protein
VEATVGVGFGVEATVGVGVALDVGVGEVMLEVFTVQPAIDKEATKSNRTTIAVIGFNRIRLCKTRTLA